MPFDDDEADAPTAPPAGTAAAQAPEDLPTVEETLEEELQDFQLFGSFTKKNISSQSIRKGEKDFESHGTRAQEAALEQSRQVMEDVLSYTRVHRPTHWLRGWYFPDHWEGAADDGSSDRASGDERKKGPKKWELNTRERVVVVEADSGQFKTMGRIITGQTKDQPGWDKIWLLPEEALFLVERGSLDLWWPMRPLADIFPVATENPEVEADQDTKLKQTGDEDDEYSLGLPLSLEAAYSLLIGNEGERGKVTLRKFQVYSNLSRAGYRVFRALSSPTQVLPPRLSTPLWQWLVSLLFSEREPRHEPYGPLVQPGLYRSYKSIYQQLALVPRHKPSPQPSSSPEPQDPFRLHYYVWKSSAASWSKTRPPPPDFYLAVADAQESSVPTLEEITALLDSTPWDPPKAQWSGPGRLYPRLKYGYRNVLVAVVDHGVVNYMRFGEGAFGEETLWQRFDSGRVFRGGKRGGGRGGRRGRGGGRGRGRGR